jgi:hypothetical protein
MKKSYFIYLITIISLILITIIISLIQRYFVYPVLNKPMIHENCTILWTCNVEDGILGRVHCSCVYYDEKCKNNRFTNGCLLKNS